MIRITLERKDYSAMNGEVRVYARTIVEEFEDHYEAANWFINDSYFDEPYTAKATWEIVGESE